MAASLMTPALRRAHQPVAAAFEGDLRPVTILFADVRGFTRLSEVLPPEQLVAAINGCFDVLDTAITHYGGEVDKFIGDAVMATFGAPTAHEDDPRRAVLAALEMQAALRRFNVQLRKQIGSELEMRIGINTGVVLAGPIGSQRKRAYTVMGDAVNVAARLEHSAPVGSVLIGESTRAQLGDAFRLRLRRSVRIRGKDAPVRSYVVLGQSDRFQARRDAERFLGRETELDEIRIALGSLRNGTRAVVEVEGNMGIGKSAIVHAVRKSAAGGDRAWLNVACPPYGQDLPYTTLAGLLRGLLQRLERADGAHALELVLAASSDGLDSELAAAVVRDLLAQSKTTNDRTSQLPAQLRKGLLARATKVLLQAAAARRPVVIAMDDCHWLDSASAAILSEAIGDLADVPIGWLLLHRPGWQSPATWPVDKHLTLLPLGADTCAELASTLLGDAATPSAIKFIVERAEGSPLYVLELCSAVAEAGEASAVPDAILPSVSAQPRYLTDQLRAMILSRIDALDETARRVVHVAAVLGHAFPATLLRSVLGTGDWRAVLSRLEEHNIFVRESRTRGDGRGSTWFWHFRHPLVQETVYASLLSATRSGLHRIAGDALEGMSDEQVADRLALLALHFGRSDDRERAVQYLCSAGDRSRVLYLNREAIHYYEDALSRLGNTGADRQRRAEVLASLGAAFEVLAEDEAALDSLQAAVDLETRLEVQADLWRQIAEIHRRRGTYAAAHQDLTRAEACLVGSQDPLPLARVRIARSMLAVFRGAYAEARLLGAEAIALLANVDAPLDRASAYRAVGIAAGREEDLPVAGEAFSRALEAAREGNDALLAATVSFNLGCVLHLQEQRDEARERYRQSLEFYERIGAKRGIALASNNLGDLCWRDGRGNWEEASTYWQRAQRLYDEIGDQRGLAIALRNLGEAQVRLGLLDNAEPLLRQARGLANDLEDDEIRDGVDHALAKLWAARQA